jgi:ubiquitin carboxyl-terminal hydrolase 4/11
VLAKNSHCSSWVGPSSQFDPFLTTAGNSWKKDLNADNPLGHKGQIASIYADLLKHIYDGSSGPFTPRQFKATLGRLAPLFSGYGQQDSQEFMSFLVDGLHEDLNRIRQKPYTENPDFDDSKINDLEAIKELGEVYKKNYQLRNSSVITDLFNGFYKNKLVCPVCGKISITFDPYLLLTLQLPIDHHWQFPFTYVPINGKPIRISIDNEKGLTMKSLKQFVASRIPGTTPERMIMAEIFSHKFYRVMKDSESIAEANIQARDDMVIYELEQTPTNFPPSKKLKMKSMLDIDPPAEEPEEEVEEQQLVPVFHRLRNRSYVNSNSNVLWPSFIMVNKHEASDYNEILRKLLRIAQNASTRESLLDLATRKEDSDAESQAPPDDEELEDGEMSTDEMPSRTVKTRSLDSEDGFVDVEMTGVDDAKAPTAPSVDFLQPGAEIPAPLTELFNICVGQFPGVIPVGFQSHFDVNGNHPLLKERIPRPETEESEKASDSPEPADASEESTQEEAPERSEAEVSYYQNEGGDELSSITVNKPGSNRNKKNNKNRQKKKYQQKLLRQQKNGDKRATAPASFSPVDSDDSRLIRANEVIILDWNADAYAELFEKPYADSRTEMEEFDDPSLLKKKASRDARRKKGISLDDCFEETSKEEILTEENAWYCDRCKEHRLASKKLEVWTVPDILVVHLKRFSGNRTFRDKIDLLVDFPTEALDLHGKVEVDDGKELIYDLFAVDNHYGGLGGGHYTAFAKNFYDDVWYEFNDSSVSKRDAVCTPAAYLLFYRRRSAHPLGSPEIQKIVNRALDGATDSETDSRDNSPSEDNSKSGNGRRPLHGDPLFHNGSLSGSAIDPAVARRPLGTTEGGLAGARLAGQHRGQGARGMGQRRTGMGQVDEDDDEDEDVIGPHRGGVGLDDEGIDMDENDDLLPSFQSDPYGQSFLATTQLTNHQTWDWSELPDPAEEPTSTTEHGGDADAEADGEDFASDVAAEGSDDEFDNGAARIIEDFGDQTYHAGDDDTDIEDQSHHLAYPGESVMTDIGFVTTMAGHTHDLRSHGRRYPAGRASPMEQEDEVEEHEAEAHEPQAVVHSIETNDSSEEEDHIKKD